MMVLNMKKEQVSKMKKEQENFQLMGREISLEQQSWMGRESNLKRGRELSLDLEMGSLERDREINLGQQMGCEPNLKKGRELSLEQELDQEPKLELGRELNLEELDRELNLELGHRELNLEQKMG
ncbi:hypothetical protein OIU74_020857 [Salix koriyanagi]|uniref:Uncharacterized protein n=1 Tax=Salix koriyanagi TaxID=2511006 RepID=A0A9Q0SMX1_9ROSI|nr:hypothetical protein OIU74_020857 [Salix koriyanagi]